MKLVMMGTGPFAVPTLEALADSHHQVVAVVARPPANVRTRGKQPPQPMRDAAERRAIPLLSPSDINAEAARQELAELEADLLVVCDYGQILSAETLSTTPLGGINLHGSLLPKYRGAAPVQWALLNGDTETGTTVIHMTPRLDAGPALVQRRVQIDPHETAEQLEGRLAADGVHGVLRAIELLEAWDGESQLGELQDPSLATRAPRLRKQDGEVDWNKPAAAIFNQVRALTPWPGTYTTWTRNGNPPLRLILKRVSVEVEQEVQARPGTIVACDSESLRVATGAGTLAISQLQPAGKRAMSAGDFARGHAITAGTLLGS